MNLRTKTIIGIAVIEIIMLLVLVLSAMSYMGSSNERQLIQRAHATATMFSHAIKDAVLTTDLATLEDLVAEIMTLEDVKYVRITSFEKVLSTGGDQALLDRNISIDENLEAIHDGIFDTSVEILSADKNFGNIEIGFSTSTINIMLNKARKAFVSIASLEVLLVALFSFILGNYLTRNLVKLRNAALAVSKQGPGLQITFNQNDELGEVVEAFNTMSEKLAKNYSELETAREEAEIANESKSRFLTSMSHEIRTPMNGVLGLLASLQRSPLNKEQLELVDTATESGHLLLALINNILDLSRMETDNVVINRQDMNLNETIKMVINSCSPTAKSLGLQLESTISGVPPYVIGDATRFKQILLNLVGNALKFTEKGCIVVDVQGIENDDNQVIVTCKVTDTGIGIAADSIPHLFDEFTMEDQTFSRTHEGSGLGLSICKRLVALMDGDISVESMQGIGSCFTFTLPFDISDPSYVEVPERAPPISDPSFANKRVLIAEDNRANQLVVKHLFHHIGIEIDIANNGLEAIEKIKDNGYDIVFMDISMPEMDGLEACQIIRSLDDKTKADLPIIAFTAHALAGDKEKFISAGMTNYLSKPVNLSHLTRILNLYIGHQDDRPTNVATKTLEQTAEVTKHSNQRKDDTADDETLSIVDEKTLRQIVKDTSADTLPILIEHYIKEAHLHKEVILGAKNTNDYDKLQFESHTLSSSSMALGNTALSQLAKQVEQHCMDKEFDLALINAEELIALTDLSLDMLHKRSMQGFE